MNLAIEKDLIPYYQLQFNENKEPVGAEILSRSRLGDITVIVEDFERFDRIEEIDLQAFSYALKFKESFDLKVSSNFSGTSLGKRKVAETIGFMQDASDIQIELTETSKLSDIALLNIKKLAEVGFKFALDDYGSDRNGLNRIVDIDFSEIKVDKHICDNLPHKRAIIAVENALDLGDRLKCDVVVEGVEYAWQFKLLKGLGVKRFQGYYLHMPEEFVF